MKKVQVEGAREVGVWYTSEGLVRRISNGGKLQVCYFSQGEGDKQGLYIPKTEEGKSRTLHPLIRLS